MNFIYNAFALIIYVSCAKMNQMKKTFFVAVLIFSVFSGFCYVQALATENSFSQSSEKTFSQSSEVFVQNNSFQNQTVSSKNSLPDIHHNPWALIIYRSENDSSINNIKCRLKITDEDGNDAFKTKIKASYEWVSSPGVMYPFQKTPYLLGGMAVHLNLKKGKYKISVYTDESELYYYGGEAKSKWESNVFFYDTENPAKVIFVYPRMNENGFYSGQWLVSSKAPSWFKFTKPAR